MTDLIEIDEPAPPSHTRLYSRGHRDHVPLTDIPPQHARLHEELIVWGRWNSSRRYRLALASLEGRYTKLGSPPTTAPLSEQTPSYCVELERAVLRLPSKPRRAVRLLYVARYSPSSICAALFIRPQRYSAFMHVVRCMISNIRRRMK
jgi:DNA-directed RNA polymerase specialized sigma24 family protein